MTNEEIDALWMQALETAHGSAIVYEFARLVAAAEREACAKLCDEIESNLFAAYKGHPPYEQDNRYRGDSRTEGQSDGAGICATAIRARGEV